MTMQAVIDAPSATLPWYRQRWPWLLMIAPAVAFVGGIFTFYLAATTSDALVVDDYYRQGKAINLVLDRDRRAAELGLTATLASAADGALTIRLQSTSDAPLPSQLSLRIVHATRAELDRQAVLPGTSERGLYRRADLALPADGRWNVQIESPDRSWRLVGVASGGFEKPLALHADAR